MAPMRRPRMWRSWLSRSWSMRWPCSRIWPETMRPGGSSKPMMAAPVSDLPAPDSPTTPRISPGAMEKLMSSSARKLPRRPGHLTTKFLTSRSDMGGGACYGQAAVGSAQAGVERIAQPVAQQVHRQRNQHQHGARENGNPPFAREQEVVAGADQRAQRGRGRRRAHAQEGQRGLGDDRRCHLYRGQHQHRPHDVGQHMPAHDAQRAACTYSLLRWTSVEPRTVRAYCTPPVSEIDRISTTKASDSWACGNSTRPTPAITKPTRIGGKDTITSPSRLSPPP